MTKGELLVVSSLLQGQSRTLFGLQRRDKHILKHPENKFVFELLNGSKGLNLFDSNTVL